MRDWAARSEALPPCVRGGMDLTDVVAEALDALPAHRTLGIRIDLARDGEGRASMVVDTPVQNVVGGLHFSGVAALVDAAALAALLSVAPNEDDARRLLPLFTRADLRLTASLRGTVHAVCRLEPPAPGSSELPEGSRGPFASSATA